MAMISNLLEYSLKSGASDLHLSVGSTPMVRIHGEMKPLDMDKLDKATMESIANQILTDSQKEIFEKNLEIDFSTALEDKGRFRVNFFNQLNGVSAVFRTIPSEILSVEELGLPTIFNQLAEKEKGLILLTGPTGSGKSTTLAAMIDHVNSNFRKPGNLMIEKLFKEWNINKKKSYMIGDKISDKNAAEKSNIKFKYVEKNLLKQVIKI